MPIAMPTGITVRTVTFWYPAAHLGIDDWTVPLSTLFDDKFQPDPRLLALPVGSNRLRALLAAPIPARETRCAGGRLDLLDLATTGAHAARQARSRYDDWSRTGTIRGRRPGRLETALLQAGQYAYVTYHRLRRVVGDALVTMRTGEFMYPTRSTPRALLDHVHQATTRLADAQPHDVLVTVTT